MTSASDALQDSGSGSAAGDRPAFRYDLASGIGCCVLWGGSPLSIMVSLQFVMATALLAIAMSIGEPMTPLRAASFLFIWAGAPALSVGAVAGRS